MKQTPDHRIRLRIESRPQAPEGPPKKLPITAVLAITLFFLFWLSLVLIVPYREWVFSPAWVFMSVRRRFQQLYAFLFGEGSAFGITVYQYLAVMLCGGALSACGTVLKGSFRNVMAGPSTMGVMAGGSLGCLIYVLLFTENGADVQASTFDAAAYAGQSFGALYGRQLCTLLGCFGGVALILAVATAAGRGRLSASAMILSGTVFSVLIQNISMVIQYYMILQDPNDTRIESIRDLMMGSFDRVTTWQHVVMMAIPILLCLGLLLALSGRLNLLALDELEAASMGLPVRKCRYLMVAVSTVLTAVVVAFCGHIGMLGFMIPLVGRRLSGPDLRRQLPVNMLLGAIMLTLVFDTAYIAGLTSYLNLFTSSIGGVVMLAALLTGKGGAGHAAFQR